ncbi:XRE family transcriptional regulator [Blastococcus sp. CT_GayMR20]|uniref:helix-turn-helix domain-containing protein n=1 Tax=Blastococcus sp. CT_GayMR20 TaxID=2559609 RepID=UPI001073D299|nr:helix-turn-helix domain-containing protein [Blastococcus sp. CT_GayMR20]TFV92604.1 XRE family transcriptional regulator [Blastococcus sp. CT_GayMR20]TFV92609.1 XRE family transcriptional regulator [Blastococcus sp. CT_GayMR20]
MSGTLGERLRAARVERGWTLREVEARSGVRNAHLSQIESGAIERPDTGLLWTLAGIYELDFADLMTLAGRTVSASNQQAPHRRSLAGAALRALDDLTPAQQEEALAFMDALRRSGGAGRSRKLGSDHRNKPKGADT